MDRIQEEHVLCDEVAHFVTNHDGYFAYTQAGLALTILHAHSVQPAITDHNRYDTWLWLECLEGYYLLRQQVVDNEPKPWHVVRRIVPHDPLHFFHEFLDALDGYLAQADATGSGIDPA